MYIIILLTVVIYLTNIFMSIINKNWFAAFGWACALIWIFIYLDRYGK
jgi:hypothetical protein